MSIKAVTVSALVRYLKDKLDNETALQRIIVQGELSNFTHHRSGHYYFTLKDANSRISCVMFASSVKNCQFKPKDGDQVYIQANTSIFEASGQLQLYCTAMKLSGIGDLFYQYEQLKKKLFEEGLFDEKLKKPLPRYPFTIGLITGKNTAAREDVLTTINRRWPLATIKEIPTLVQGTGASLQMIEALKQMDKQQCDVILLVRGGGSIEDLWAFNDEALARTIVGCKTPVVSGVGHEVDTTIVDYVSDKRAATPTAAAEMITPNLSDVLLQVENYKSTLLHHTKTILAYKSNQLSVLSNHQVLNNPERLIEGKLYRVEVLNNRLQHQLQKSSMIKVTSNQLFQRFFHCIQLKNQELSNKNNQLNNRLQQCIMDYYGKQSQRLNKTIALLDAYSPLKILTRGYSIVFKNNVNVSSIDDVMIQDELQIRLSDGYITTIVKEKKDGK